MSRSVHTLNRRIFLHGMAATSGLAGISSLFPTSARAADTSGYKALVCIFLKGGMDHADTVLPFEQTEYDQLRDTRAGLFAAHDAAGNGRRRDDLLVLQAANSGQLNNRRFGLPTQLAPLHDLFVDGDLAIVGNVGPLAAPTNRLDFESRRVELPKRLFSHNDQQSTWMSLAAEGERFGWGGRFVDAATANIDGPASAYSAITVGGNDVFLSGQSAQAFQAPTGTVGKLRIFENLEFLGPTDRGDAARLRLRDAVTRGNYAEAEILERDLGRMITEGIANNDAFADASNAASENVSTVFPDTGLGAQLAAIARTISIQDALGVSRQVFFAALGGFDTHASQSSRLPALHTELADAMAAFRLALGELGQWSNVTTFTASDFGRTLNISGNGTDHGWGGHHFVAGGAVRGQRIFGSMPAPDTDGDAFTESRARMIPTVAVEQYGASLGRWFGLNNTEINNVFPNLSRFTSAEPQLF